MWGAIIGDLAGSTYEFGQLKEISKIEVKTLIKENSFFSDDTILTISILEAILKNLKYEYNLKKYVNFFREYKPNFSPYFSSPFSPGFINWANSEYIGTSIGNGAMMRISPVGYLFNNEKEIIENARLATIPSHNSPEAIKSTTIIAMIIYLSRCGYPKEEIIKKLKLDFEYTPFLKFNTTCHETIDNSLYALFTSNTFEESIKKVISYGGDTDTNACIVGSMAEALYGIDENTIKEAKTKIPEFFSKLLDEGYKKVKKNVLNHISTFFSNNF